MNQANKLQESPQTGLDRLAIVTVTYHPDLEILKAQALGLPENSIKVIVDNKSDAEEIAALRMLAGSTADTTLIENPENLGLPAALNLGIRRALELRPRCSHVLVLDQDTEPRGNAIATLLYWYEQLNATGEKIGCVGPRMIDAVTGLEHGFHQIVGWRWVRRFPETEEVQPVQCENLNCSGTLMSSGLFNRLGGFDETFFVDHLDTEWSFRVSAAGFKLYGVPAASFTHRMGEASWRFWIGRWRIWPYRSPQRHFLLFRNAVRMMRRPYVPAVWKFWAVVKLLVTMCTHALFDGRRWQQLASMARGIRGGLKALEK